MLRWRWRSRPQHRRRRTAHPGVRSRERGGTAPATRRASASTEAGVSSRPDSPSMVAMISLAHSPTETDAPTPTGVPPPARAEPPPLLAAVERMPDAFVALDLAWRAVAVNVPSEWARGRPRAAMPGRTYEGGGRSGHWPRPRWRCRRSRSTAARGPPTIRPTSSACSMGRAKLDRSMDSTSSATYRSVHTSAHETRRFRRRKEPMELGPASALEPLGDLGHDRHRGPLKLPSQPPIPRELPLFRHLTDGARKGTGLLPRREIFEPLDSARPSRHHSARPRPPSPPPVLSPQSSKRSANSVL